MVLPLQRNSGCLSQCFEGVGLQACQNHSWALSAILPFQIICVGLFKKNDGENYWRVLVRRNNVQRTTWWFGIPNSPINCEAREDVIKNGYEYQVDAGKTRNRDGMASGKQKILMSSLNDINKLGLFLSRCCTRSFEFCHQLSSLHLEFL